VFCLYTLLPLLLFCRCNLLLLLLLFCRCNQQQQKMNLTWHTPVSLV
jgi:hypothetical protein